MRHFRLFPLPPRRMRYRRMNCRPDPLLTPFERRIFSGAARLVKVLAFLLLLLMALVLLVDLLTGCAWPCQPTLALNPHPDRVSTVECVGMNCHWEF